MLKSWIDRFNHWFQEDSSQRDRETDGAYLPKEKVLVFSLSLILAFCLWFIVNLSRDFSISVDFPMQVEHLSDELALVQDPPSLVQVGLTGEGWNLISLYRNPPTLVVESTEQDVNLFEVVQQQLSVLSNVNVTQVRPARVLLELEEKRSRDVVVIPNLKIQLRERYQLLDEPTVTPERVTIRGALSVVSDVDTLYTESIVLQDVSRSGDIRLPVLLPDNGLELDEPDVHVEYQVAEFTEGEMTVPIRVRDLPGEEQIRYQPSTVNIRYDVPIEQYNAVQEARPFRAFIEYSELMADTTGSLIPRIETMDGAWTLRVRQIRPSRIRYFRIVEP
ncbi:MAG: CdaR family protein [Balneolaceae bacterium]